VVVVEQMATLTTPKEAHHQMGGTVAVDQFGQPPFLMEPQETAEIEEVTRREAELIPLFK
jgi:hypothetical protein